MVTKLSNMNRLSYARSFLVAALLGASAFGASADDRFSIAVGSHNLLIVANPKGGTKS